MAKFTVFDLQGDYPLIEEYSFNSMNELEKVFYEELIDTMANHLSDYPNEDIENLTTYKELVTYVKENYTLEDLLDFYEYELIEIDKDFEINY